MIRYFLKNFGANFRAHKMLTLLSVCGVALGVASVTSIQLINQNAIAAFRAGVDVISGPADFTVIGQDSAFDEKLYPLILKQPGVLAAWPSIQANVALKAASPYYLQIFGVDFFSSPARRWSPDTFDLSEALGQKGWCALTPQLANELHVTKGDSLAVSLGSKAETLIVGGEVDLQKWAPLASRKIVLMDIAQAQTLFGKRGLINQVDIKVAAGVDPAAFADRLRATLGTGVDVLTASDREKKASGLLSAFQLNLTALSMISVFVGLFLVFSTTQAALIRRRQEFGLLRTLGAARAQILLLVLGETLVLGVAGVAIGLPLGVYAAQLNLRSVSDTISNLYILSEIDHLALPLPVLARAAAIGLGAAVLGALLPAIDLCRKDTKALLAAFTLHEKAGAAAPKLFAAAVALLSGLSIWMLLGGVRVRASGFMLAASVLAAIPLMTPFLMGMLLRRITLRSLGWRFSLKSLAVRIGTTSFAVAGVAVAVTMLVGVTLMISSFRQTVDVWIGQTLDADIYITSSSWRRARETATLDQNLVDHIAADGTVARVDRLRQIFVNLDGKQVPISGVQMPAPLSPGRIPLVEGDATRVLENLNAGRILIGEPLRRLQDHKIGDTLTLKRNGRSAFLTVAGVYYDYGNTSGSILISLPLLNHLFGDGPITNLALTLNPGVDVETTVDRLKAAFPDVPIEIRSNRQLRKEVMGIFDQTFAVTRLLQVLSLLIAGCGIALTLFVFARERVSEWALLRALGARRSQLVFIFLGQGLGIGALGSALGFVGGLALMGISVFLINRAYFGWTVQLYWPGWMLARQFAAILAVAIIASVGPAIQAGRISAKELSREDQ